MRKKLAILTRASLPLGVGIIGLGILAMAPACAPQKRTYTVPSVTKEIEGSVRQARKLKDQGKLKDASKLLLKVGRAVLSEYPQTTVTQEPVKKLLEALQWIANLSLDRSLELRNEAVSSEEDKLSKDFAAWADEHRENASKIRDLLPRLRQAEATPARPAGGGDPKAPRPAGAGEPGEPREPGKSGPSAPTPSEPADTEEPS